MNARASEIQFMKPINSKKNNKHAFHGKGENKLTFVEPIQFFFQACHHKIFLVILQEKNHRELWASVILVREEAFERIFFCWDTERS